MTTSAAAAVRRGARALELARHDGLWRGFPTLAGTSDEWVSGFVLAHLPPDAAAEVDVDAARALLAARQRDTGGWGFGPAVPTDADSTAWSLAALTGAPGDAGAHHLPGDAVGRALAALERHRVGDAWATYRAGAGIEDFVGVPVDGAPGWTAPHPDVTAAVLLALQPHLDRGSPDDADDDAPPPSPATPHERFESSLRRLLACADGTGLVPAYWWRGLLYTSALTLRLLDRVGRRAPEEWERAAVEGLVRLQTPSGGYRLGSDAHDDAFTTALALECWCRLAHHDDDGRRHRVAEALLAQQDGGGGWVGGFVLRLPSPEVVDPSRVSGWRRGAGGGNAFVPDPGGVFATAAAVHALDLWDGGRRSGATGDVPSGAAVPPAGRRPVEPAHPARGEAEVLVLPDGRPATDLPALRPPGPPAPRREAPP